MLGWLDRRIERFREEMIDPWNPDVRSHLTGAAQVAAPVVVVDERKSISALARNVAEGGIVTVQGNVRYCLDGSRRGSGVPIFVAAEGSTSAAACDGLPFFEMVNPGWHPDDVLFRNVSERDLKEYYARTVLAFIFAGMPLNQLRCGLGIGPGGLWNRSGELC